MYMGSERITRRQLLASASATAMGLGYSRDLFAYEPKRELAGDDSKALVAITLDLEMARHYPKRDMMEWDYIKGCLNDQTKQYAREACRRVKAAGGVLHSFLLGRTLEQADVGWLEEIIAEGHPIGNHTYDHVNVWSGSPLCQYRFRRGPWLVHGMTAAEVIRNNIRITDVAMKTRLGIKSEGFRTPGGSHAALDGRPDLQKMLLDLGFTYLTSKTGGFGKVRSEKPTGDDYAEVVRTQAKMQPYVYPSGLIEIPANPMGDVACFRGRRWKIGEFCRMIESNLKWVIDNRAVYDFFSHPSILYVEDPEFKAIDLICRIVNANRDRAAIVGLDVIAERARLRHQEAGTTTGKT